MSTFNLLIFYFLHLADRTAITARSAIGSIMHVCPSVTLSILTLRVSVAG